MRLQILPAALLLSLTAAAVPSPSALAEALRSFKGQPISSIISRVGYPDRRENMLDEVIYYWNADFASGESCRFRVATDQKGIITGASAYGNEAGCKIWLSSVRDGTIDPHTGL